MERDCCCGVYVEWIVCYLSMFFKAFTKYVILDCSLVFLILLKIANAVEKGFKKLISAPRLDIGGG